MTAQPRIRSRLLTLSPALPGSKGDTSCARALLGQGADPAAGGDESTLRALHGLEAADAAGFQRMPDTFLEHGFDPLAPVHHTALVSLLALLQPGVTARLVGDLERQRAAGGLQLGSALVVGAARASGGCHP